MKKEVEEWIDAKNYKSINESEVSCLKRAQ